MTHRRACIGLLALARTSIAHADPPAPPLRCTPSTTAVRVAIDGIAGPVSRLAAVRDGDRVVVAMRVLPTARGHGGTATTRIVLGEIGADGAWATSPRIVATTPGRVDGPLELVAHDGARAVVDVGVRTARWTAVGSDAGNDRSIVLARPARDVGTLPVVAAGHDAFTLVWHRRGTLSVQHLGDAHDAVPDAAVTARVPGGSDVVAASAGATAHTTALVAQSPGRRFFIALVDDDGRFTWTGNAPAGCDHGRCPGVRLLPCAGGYVAAWYGRPTRDGLANVGARALGTDGRIRGRAPAFIPMAHAVVVAGPEGQPLALHLGRPIVLRGLATPVALALADSAPREFPAAATAWIDVDPPGTLEVLSTTRNGALTLARVRCDPLPGD